MTTPDESTPTADGPEKAHGDPLLDAAQGRGDDVHGSRHGYDAEAAARTDSDLPD